MAHRETAFRGIGIGLGSALGLIFITLKLCGVVAWSWVWVLSPFWIPLAFVGSLMLVVGAGFLLCLLILTFISLFTLKNGA